MNKMTKGALVTGLGVALLVGGGGTLAVWNAEAINQAGTIASGDLNITAAPGVWTNASTKTIDISSYKVVPGDKLTFTQPVKVTLVGDRMQANLTLTDPEKATTAPLVVSDVTLTDKDGANIKENGLLPADSGDYTATVTVELPDTVKERDFVNQVRDLKAIGFKLDQMPYTEGPAPVQQ